MPESNENSGTEGLEGTEGQQNDSRSTEAKTPEWYEKELSKTRNEAAGYRTKLRDAETKLSGAKSVEEFEAARTELTAANQKLEHELLVERIGKGLPDEMLPLLTGKTEEELKAQAEALKKFAPATTDPRTPPKKLGGGLKPSSGGDDFDAKKVASQLRAGW